MPKQFDVCKNPNKDTESYAPFLLILQSDMIETHSTCVVAPLVRVGSFQPAQKLHPVVTIENDDYVISTAELAGISRQAIGPVVFSLQDQRDDIIAALDLLFLGF